MKEKIIVSTLTAIIVTGVLWLLGVIGKTTISLIVPSKAVVAFNIDKCPEGWSPFVQSRGRYIVGLTRGGTVGAEVGVKLANEENRPTGQHQHTYTDTYVGGSGSGSKVQSGQSWPRPTVSKSTSLSDGVQGTNAPYVQLLYCEKD